MALYIKDEAVYKDLQSLSSITGESLTEAARVAIRERLAHIAADKKSAKKRRTKKLEEFLGKRKKIEGYNFDHKKFTDSLWGI